jgi:UDP-glucose 4-epimerase
MRNILVSGGAGYTGSPVVRNVDESGYNSTVLAKADMAKNLFAFSPEYTDIRGIIKTGWQRERKRRYG